MNKSTGVGFALGRTEPEGSDKVTDWFNAFSQFTLLRRAAEDAHTALTLKSEAILFVYRAYEWLKKELAVSWNDLGKAIDIPQSNLKTIKRMANDWDAASRHAVESGKKLRFEEEVLPGWVHGLLHGIVHTRCKLDPAFAACVERDGDPYPI